MTVPDGGGGPFTDLVPPHEWTDVCKADASATPPKGNKAAVSNLNNLVNLHSAGKKNELKSLVRAGHWPVDHSARSKLWPFLVRVDKGKTEMDFENLYDETCSKLFRTNKSSGGGDAGGESSLVSLPGFVDSNYLIHHKLGPQGQRAVARVIAALAYNRPAITYAPVLYSQAALFLHYLREHEVYALLSYLTESSKYIAQTQRAHDTQWRIVMALCKKYSRAAYGYLNVTLQSPEKMERLFEGWTWWIFRWLPFPHLVRVMDCFLVEGPKVLYRVSFAILNGFYQKQGTRAKVNVPPGDVKAMDNAICDYCRNIPHSSAKLLELAFGIRRFSRDDVERCKSQVETSAASGDGHGHGYGYAGHHNEGGIVRSRSTELCVPVESLGPNCKTLTVDELMKLWAWIPVRMTMCTPTLLFTTEEHGYNLRLLYELVEEYEPTVLLIKNFKDEVFGAYCSSRWKERNLRDDRGTRRRFFGTGETFVFTLSPEAKKYRWVGLDVMDSAAGREEQPASIRHAAELFQSGDRDMLVVGGGKGSAIWLDADLRYGKSESCQTFDNPPLSTDSDFEVKVVEIFGFV